MKNANELREQMNDYVSAARVALENAQKSLDADDGSAEAHRNEAKSLFEKADVLKEQLRLMAQADSYKSNDEGDKPKETKSAAHRLPFEDESEESAKGTGDAQKAAAYVLQFGEIDSAVKQVAEEMYGKDYLDRRLAQRRSFAKYVRAGERRMTAKDWANLNEMIYTPDVIRQEVTQGFSVKEIVSNKETQVEATLELGGVLVPEDVRMEIVRELEGPATIRSIARVITTARDAVEWPKLESDGDDQNPSLVRVTWVDEVPDSATVAETNFRLGTIKIPVHTAMARVDLSRNLLEDAGVNIISELGMMFGEAMRQDENEQFVVGTGVGRPEGILGKRTGNNGANVLPIDGVRTVALGSATTLTADGIIDMEYELPIQYRNNRTVWLGANGTFKTIRKLKDGNGDYLWQRGLTAGAPATLNGYNFLTENAVPAIAANTYPLLFMNGNSYLIVERVGMSIERVDDTTTVGRNKTAVFLRRRVGGQCIMPWGVVAGKVATTLS